MLEARKRLMRVSILGLGYVGCTTAAYLAYKGISVIGVDVHQQKVDLINSGKGTFKEDLVHELIHTAILKKTLYATTDEEAAVLNSDVTFICVGTPGKPDGSVNFRALESTCQSVGRALKKKDGFHTIVIRSTVPPGTTESILIPILEETSGKKAFVDFEVCVNPEFMREGTSVHDFQYPSRTVVGVNTDKSVDLFKTIYRSVKAPFVATDIRTAEFIKYMDNGFHALKVSFANEIASLCKSLNINVKQVFDIFLMDKKLNISEAYLRPGLPFGGSCLPKEVRVLQHLALQKEKYPLTHAILSSNAQRKKELYEAAVAHKRKQIGVLGISFKEGTDDMRESPILETLKSLHDTGYSLHVYDTYVKEETLLPLNKQYAEEIFPELFSCVRDSVKDIAEKSELIIFANADPTYLDILPHLSGQHVIFDCSGLLDGRSLTHGKVIRLWP